MKIIRVNAPTDELARAAFTGWSNVPSKDVALIPTPLNGNPAIKAISPFIEKSTDHGTVSALRVSLAHNGDIVAVRLMWQSDKHDKIVDLDEFVDGVAVMFPLTPGASAFTMGSESDPVNAWYWKGNLRTSAFEVVAKGYGTSVRNTPASSNIRCDAEHVGEHWHVVLSRALSIPGGSVVFQPGEETRMAFAVWDGGNRERSGRKSFSGDFVPVEIAP